MSAETLGIPQSPQVLARRGDTQGFTPQQQEFLNARVIAERMAGVLGPIPDETKPKPKSRPRPRRGTQLGDINIADGLITSTDPRYRQMQAALQSHSLAKADSQELPDADVI